MEVGILDYQNNVWYSVLQEVSTGLPADMQFVRVLHEAELPPDMHTNPAKQPEVRPLFPNHFSTFGQGWQNSSWSINPLQNGGNMTAVYNDHLWIANDHGFGNTPHANYFLMEDLDASDIKVESLTCGGNLLHVIGEGMFKTSGTTKVPCFIIEVLDYKTPVNKEFLDAHPWLVTTAVKLDGQGNPTRFPQGQGPNGYPPGVWHPLVCNTVQYPQVVIEKWRVTKWDSPEVPDPYKVYLPVQ